MDLELFKAEVLKLGVRAFEDKLVLLDKYYNLLVNWNKKMNLTAITDKRQVYLKHFYDSLTILKVIDINDISSLCDVGTGAGFPGIVLKIFFPHIKLTLIDSLGKRTIFLKEVVDVLKLDNVEIYHVRAEEYAKENREKFDLVTARAVSSFNVLLEYCIPLVKVSGYFAAMRGSDDTDTGLNAIKIFNLSVIKKVSFKLPIESSERTLCLLVKNKQTDRIYPRRNSEIKKRPL